MNGVAEPSLYKKLAEMAARAKEVDDRLDEQIAARFRLTKREVRRALDEIK